MRNIQLNYNGIIRRHLGKYFNFKNADHNAAEVMHEQALERHLRHNLRKMCYEQGLMNDGSVQETHRDTTPHSLSLPVFIFAKFCRDE